MSCLSPDFLTPNLPHFQRTQPAQAGPDSLSLMLLLHKARSWAQASDSEGRRVPLLMLPGLSSFARPWKARPAAQHPWRYTKTAHCLLHGMTMLPLIASADLWPSLGMARPMAAVQRVPVRKQWVQQPTSLFAIHRLWAMSSIVCLIALISVTSGPNFLACSKMLRGACV